MRRMWGWLLLGALGGACGVSDAFIEAPPDLPARGSVLFVLRTGDRVRLFAASGEDRPLFSLDLPAGEPFEITALVYGDGLEAVNLSAGAIDPINPSECGARPLPEPRSQYSWRSDDSGWSALDVVPQDLAGLHISGSCPCSEVAITAQVPMAFEPRTGVVEDGAAVFFGPQGRVARLHHDGRYELLTLPSGPEQPRAALRAADGSIWIAADDGLWSGDLQRGLSLTATVSEPDALRDLAGGDGPAGLELFAVTQAGTVVSFAAGRSDVLSRRAEGPADSSQRPRLTWSAPGTVLASEPGTFDLVLFAPDRPVQRLSLPHESRGARIVEYFDGVGVVIITWIASAYRLIDGELAPILDVPELATPNAAIPFEHGFAYVGDGGYVQQYSAGFGFCPTQFLDGRPRLSGIIQIEDRLVGWGPTGDGIAAHIIGVETSVTN